MKKLTATHARRTFKPITICLKPKQTHYSLVTHTVNHIRQIDTNNIKQGMLM